MWRSMLAAAVLFLLVYLCGHPALEGYRPARLDGPLQSFHTDVNLVARMGKDTMQQVDRDRAKQQVKNFVDKVGSELSGRAP